MKRRKLSSTPTKQPRQYEGNRKPEGQGNPELHDAQQECQQRHGDDAEDQQCESNSKESARFDMNEAGAAITGGQPYPRRATARR